MTILTIVRLLLRRWMFRHTQVATCWERVCSFNPSVINMWITWKSPHIHREGFPPLLKWEKRQWTWRVIRSEEVVQFWGLRVLHWCYFLICRNLCEMNLAASRAFFLTQNLIPYSYVFYEIPGVRILSVFPAVGHDMPSSNVCYWLLLQMASPMRSKVYPLFTVNKLSCH